MPPMSSASVIDQALESQLAAQQAAEDGRGKSGRQVRRGERRYRHVSRHHRVGSGGDGGAERHQFHAFQPLPRGRDGGQIQVTIHRRVAVPREVLGRRQHVIAGIGMRAFDEGRHLRRHRLRVLAERADVENRVVGVDVHVGYRVIHPVHAQRPRLARRHLAFETRKLRIARRAESHRVRKHGGARHPHRGAAFEIAAHQQRHLGDALHPVNKRGQRVRLGVLDHVAVSHVGEDQAAHFDVADQPQKSQVLAGTRVGRRAWE